MAYRSQLCETCKHKNDSCYAAPNSTCSSYEDAMPYRADICNTCIHMNENCFTVKGKTCSNYKPATTVGNHLAMLLTNGKYKEAAKFLNEKEDINLCDYFNNEEDICTYSDCSVCWENLLKSEYKGEV